MRTTVLTMLVVFSIACSSHDGGGEDAGVEITDVVEEEAGCDLDCGPHGECVLGDDGPGCECDPGWGGDLCDAFLGSRLEVHALDIWGRALGDATLTIDVGGEAVESTLPVTVLEPGEAGTVTIGLEAEGFHPLDVTVVYGGENSGTAYAVRDVTGDVSHGLSLSRDEVDGTWVHAIYLGLRHRWFSAAGPPARGGNRLAFLMDGEEAWGRVAAELATATDSVLYATWWWESDFELVRGATPEDIHATPAERRGNTIMARLDALPGVHKRILVNQFMTQDGILQDFNVDDDLVARGAAAGDGFEFMGQLNDTEGVFPFEVDPFVFGDRVRQRWPETAARTFDAEDPIASAVPGHVVDITLPLGIDGISLASYHQKFIVIDGTRGFVGGMNTKATDWDTSEHLVFDPRRMDFDASVADREDVLAKDAASDTGPRKDMMWFVDGPIVEDAADVFRTRWDEVISEGVRFSENATTFDVARDVAGHGDGVLAQLTVTMPEPVWQHSIAETWVNAIGNAERYILIEDQYFRAPMLNELVAQRMRDVPDLVLIVITKPVNEWTDPGCWWTHITDTFFETEFPGRYMLYRLRAFDHVDVGWGFDETESRFEDIDVHTKVLVVDDLFMSMGSCNHNNRGLVYEGEMNVAVLDATFVREARRRILDNILGPYSTDPDDVSGMVDDFRQAAAWNQAVWDAWDDEGWDISLDGDPLPEMYTPRGFLYPLDFRAPEDCLLEGISEDLTID